MQAEPVVAAPAKHTADWPQRKQNQQTIERSQLGWFEFD
jgi:hypothetical protein